MEKKIKKNIESIFLISFLKHSSGMVGKFDVEMHYFWCKNCFTNSWSFL